MLSARPTASSVRNTLPILSSRKVHRPKYAATASYVEQNPQTVVAGRPKASPNNQWVVSNMSTTDDFSPGAAITSYLYKNPVNTADDDGKFSFRGFEEVTTTGPTGARTIQRYGYAQDWSGRLTDTLVMPKLGSGEGDTDVRTIDRTTWEPRTLILGVGTVKTFHATLSKHYTCKNGQTEASCTPTAAGGYTQTTHTLNTLSSPPQETRPRCSGRKQTRSCNPALVWRTAIARRRPRSRSPPTPRRIACVRW